MIQKPVENGSATPVVAEPRTIPSDIVSIPDYERHCQLCLEWSRFEYLASGAADELTLSRNSRAFASIDILPRVLRSLGDGSTSTRLLGRTLRHPILLGPLAHQRLFHPDGELATARAAAATDTCLVASTLASVSLESMAQSGGDNLWFQLYFQTTRSATLELVKRAEAAGYAAIMVTVDAPVSGARNRIQRSGFSLPRDARPANLVYPEGAAPMRLGPDDSLIFQGLMPQAPSWDDLHWLASRIELPIVVKGVLHPRDARAAEQAGLDGVVVSNHGGRCLDTLPATIEALPRIRAAVNPEFPVLLDGGIRRGTDIFKALALGANGVLVGRPQAWALTVAGALGVAHMLRLLREELELTMALAGTARIADITPEAVLHRGGAH